MVSKIGAIICIAVALTLATVLIIRAQEAGTPSLQSSQAINSRSTAP